MTLQEAQKELVKIRNRQLLAQSNVVNFARGLIVTLKDAKMEHAAKELERLFFQIDAEQQELSNFLQNNWEAAFQALVLTIEGKG